MVAAKQNGELVPARLVLLRQMQNLGGNAFAFVLVVAAFKDADRRPFAGFAPQLLFKQVAVVGNQCIGHAQDAPAATVVLFQLDDFELRVVARKFGQVLRIGTTPGIDALVVITHRREHAALSCQRAHQSVLRGIGVLVLVQQQIADAFLPVGAQFGIGFQQLQRQADEIIEIHGVEGRQTLLIVGIDLRNLCFARALAALGCLIRSEPLVLGPGYQILQCPQRIVLDALGCEILDQTLAVIGIQHGKPTAQASTRMLGLQKTQTQRVERAHRQSFRIRPFQQFAHTLAHLARRLVGEGDRGNFRSRQVLALDQVGNFFCDDAGLAGTGTGQHEQRAVTVLDGCALLGVEHWKAGILDVGLGIGLKQGLEIRDSEPHILA